jgi:alkylated DNA nucleotide flippase Atl1
MIPPPDGMDPASYLAISPRWVGYAMRRCASDPANHPDDPSQPSIPWQRVINSQGKISLPEGSPEAAQQRIRLEDEGVEFDKLGRVDLRRYRWHGPDTDWLRERGLIIPLSPPRDND